MTVLFTMWDYGITVIEFAAVILALLAISLGIRGTRWTWPFYFLSSLLYGWLFAEFDLFASAAMQLIFMAAAVWGWFSWGREGVQMPGRLTSAGRIRGAVAFIVLWVLIAPLLQSIGGAATWGDAFMLALAASGNADMIEKFQGGGPLSELVVDYFDRGWEPVEAMANETAPDGVRRLIADGPPARAA